jgi:hypothetical protein
LPRELAIANIAAMNGAAAAMVGGGREVHDGALRIEEL